MHATHFDPARRIACSSFVAAFALVASAQSVSHVNGDSIIRGAYGNSEIVIRTSSRMAGAIRSLTWNGKEFINETDHGRELQSASNLDVNGDIQGETFNPTEAGSRDDGAGQGTTSRLLYLRANGPELMTKNQMAFWLRPGELSSGHLAKNTNALSNHILVKRVRIGIPNHPNVIDYTVNFTLPRDEKHVHGVFEALTGYMPIEFDQFHSFDFKTRSLKTMDAGPREGSLPLIFSTKDGGHAMGIYSPPDAKIPKRTYGRFKFDAAKVTKWNCVFHINDPNGIPPADYTCHMYVIVGTLDDVRSTMDALSRAAGDT
jgi:hypothetical protein